MQKIKNNKRMCMKIGTGFDPNTADLKRFKLELAG